MLVDIPQRSLAEGLLYVCIVLFFSAVIALVYKLAKRLHEKSLNRKGE